MHVCCFPVYIISPSRKLGALSLSLYGELIDGIITVISKKKNFLVVGCLYLIDAHTYTPSDICYLRGQMCVSSDLTCRC